MQACVRCMHGHNQAALSRWDVGKVGALARIEASKGAPLSPSYVSLLLQAPLPLRVNILLSKRRYSGRR